jgi:hypothetical protein
MANHVYHACLAHLDLAVADFKAGLQRKGPLPGDGVVFDTVHGCIYSGTGRVCKD